MIVVFNGFPFTKQKTVDPVLLTPLVRQSFNGLLCVVARLGPLLGIAFLTFFWAVWRWEKRFGWYTKVHTNCNYTVVF